MRKFLTLIFIISLAPLIGGIYGIFHDQITYTISPEYYTKFKFYQFGLLNKGSEVIFSHPRVQVSIVGFMATWWMGLPIGVLLGLFSLIHKNSKKMFMVTMRAILITMIVAFCVGIIGLLYGKFYLSDIDLDWWFPENLLDKKNFIAVGTMHNFSYFGGLVGVIVGIFYIVRERGKDED